MGAAGGVLALASGRADLPPLENLPMSAKDWAKGSAGPVGAAGAAGAAG